MCLIVFVKFAQWCLGLKARRKLSAGKCRKIDQKHLLIPRAQQQVLKFATRTSIEASKPVHLGVSPSHIIVRSILKR